MALYWFFAGVLTGPASLIVIMPWLRTLPRLTALPKPPWQASAAAAGIVSLVLASSLWVGHPNAGGSAAAPATHASESAGSAFGSAAKAFGDATAAPGIAANGPGDAASPPAKAGASSMDSAIASLESRLAKGGGTPDDWELLAKSFEFLDRPADAAKARAHQLPTLPPSANATAAAASPAAPVAAATAASPAAPVSAGTAVSGEVTLAPALSTKAAAGETLFIVAKSVDAPGAPVAVLRGSVGSWPLKFTLDDSQSMLPGRNLSNAGRVTIEARISQKGQPLPAAGDLQGSSGIINPGDHRPLKILIDRVIS
jgi:cytochrome c-type biogenesis protein CcmH